MTVNRRVEDYRVKYDSASACYAGSSRGINEAVGSAEKLNTDGPLSSLSVEMTENPGSYKIIMWGWTSDGNYQPAVLIVPLDILQHLFKQLEMRMLNILDTSLGNGIVEEREK